MHAVRAPSSPRGARWLSANGCRGHRVGLSPLPSSVTGIAYHVDSCTNRAEQPHGVKEGLLLQLSLCKEPPLDFSSSGDHAPHGPPRASGLSPNLGKWGKVLP